MATRPRKQTSLERKIFIDRDGRPVAIFHFGKSLSWEHPFEDQDTCEACIARGQADHHREGMAITNLALGKGA